MPTSPQTRPIRHTSTRIRPTSRARLRVRRLLALSVLAGSGALTATAFAPTAQAADLSTWDKVAQCEATGNWSINTSNGFYGGLQFTASTWAAFGGHAYAPQAHQATRAQQIEIAEKVLKVQGPGAWPVCSQKAGLTRGGPAPQLDTTTQAALAAAPQETLPTPDHIADESADEVSNTRTYTVVQGDTLAGIGETLHTTWQELHTENRQVIGDNPDLIHPGQQLTHHTATATDQAPASDDSSIERTTPATTTAQSATKRHSNDLDGWIAEARDILAAHGDKVPSAAAIKARAMTESSGNPKAENHWDSNEARYGGTYGLLQTIKPTFAAYSLPGHKDILHPVDSIIAGVRYANDRYGSFETIAYTKTGY